MDTKHMHVAVFSFHGIPTEQKYPGPETGFIQPKTIPNIFTVKLWLSSPNLSGPCRWFFRLYDEPQITVGARISDSQFNRDFFSGSHPVFPGDVFEATMCRVTNEDGLVEIFKLHRIGNELEKFRSLIDYEL